MASKQRFATRYEKKWRRRTKRPYMLETWQTSRTERNWFKDTEEERRGMWEQMIRSSEGGKVRGRKIR